uniref:Uncharacterized protein n=1 Tax=Rhizophora mucronata TaxID=61149 RepID=A0A2P2JDU2_RHIMU
MHHLEYNSDWPTTTIMNIKMELTISQGLKSLDTKLP